MRCCSSTPVIVRVFGIVTMRDTASLVESGAQTASNASATWGVDARSVQLSGSVVTERAVGSSGAVSVSIDGAGTDGDDVDVGEQASVANASAIATLAALP